MPLSLTALGPLCDRAVKLIFACIAAVDSSRAATLAADDFRTARYPPPGSIGAR